MNLQARREWWACFFAKNGRFADNFSMLRIVGKIYRDLSENSSENLCSENLRFVDGFSHLA